MTSYAKQPEGAPSPAFIKDRRLRERSPDQKSSTASQGARKEAAADETPVRARSARQAPAEAETALNDLRSRWRRLADQTSSEASKARGEVTADDRARMRKTAEAIARAETADAITEALNNDGGSLASVTARGGPDKSLLSNLVNSKAGKKGCTVGTLALIALALGKDLKIEIS